MTPITRRLRARAGGLAAAVLVASVAQAQYAGSPVTIDPQRPSIVYWDHFKSVNRGDAWREASPGDPTHRSAVVLDPTTSTTIYAADAQGVKKSMDGGRNWLVTGLSGHVHSLAIDSRAPSTLYGLVPEEGLYRTRDGGATWHLVATTASLPYHPILEVVAVAPSGDVMLGALIANAFYDAAVLYTSDDGGQSWTGCCGLTAFAEYFHSLAFNRPVSPGSTLLYASTESGVFKGQPSDTTLTQTALTVPVGPLAVDPWNADVVYAGLISTFGPQSASLMKTTDGGITWARADAGIIDVLQPAGLPLDVTGLAIDPTSSDIVYAATCLGLFRSVDGGVSWRLTGQAPSLSTYVADFGGHGLWMWSEGTWHLLSPANPVAMVAGDLDGNGTEDLVVNLGSGIGTYALMNRVQWMFMHPFSPTQMVTGDLDDNGHDDVVFSFPGHGVWRWSDGSWTHVAAFEARHLAIGRMDAGPANDLVLDLGDYGLWEWRNNNTLRPLHGTSPSSVTLADLDGNGIDDLVAVFAGSGVWVYANHAVWTHVHPFQPAHVAAGDLDADGVADIVFDFGPDFGLWIWRNGAMWQPLHPLPAESIVVAESTANLGDDILIDFGPAHGLWRRTDEGTWQPVHPLSPDAVAAGGFL